MSGTSSHAGKAGSRAVSSASSGTTPSVFLAGEGLVAQPIPTLVELSLVLVGPIVRHVMRRVTAAGREVDEEGLVRVLASHPVQPLDGPVRHRIREVVRVVGVVVLLGRTDDLLVLRQAGIPLTRAPAEEAVEVVEAPAVRPPVERTRRPLLAVRRQVPLAEGRGAVAVVAQDPRQRRTVPRQRGAVTGESTCELPNRSKADEMTVPTGQQRGARG